MKIFFNKSALFMLASITLQQLIVASSTVWIAKLSIAVVAGQNCALWLALFVTSLFVVYLPTSATNYFVRKACYESFLGYVHLYKDTFSGHAELRTSQEFKAQLQPFLNSEAWLVIDEFYHFISDWLSVILNVAFNVVALGFVVHPSFLWAYVATMPLVGISLFGTKKIVQRLSENDQRARTAMMQTLLPGWDSIFIGNCKNLVLWFRKFASVHFRSREASLKSVISIEFVTDISMILTLAPVLSVLIWLMVHNAAQSALLAVLVATLPRQVKVVGFV